MRYGRWFVDLAGPVVAIALLAALATAVGALGPTALQRWF